MIVYLENGNCYAGSRSADDPPVILSVFPYGNPAMLSSEVKKVL